MAYPYTFQDHQNMVINKLRLDATNDLQKVKDWLNAVYTQACVETEFVRGSANSAALSASAVNVAIPAAAMRIKQVQSKAAAGTFGSPMQRITFDRLLHYRAMSTTQAQATHYSIVQTTIEFWPPAVLNDVLNFYYVAKPTILSANGDLTVMDEPYATFILHYGAMAEGADFLDDPMQDEYRQLFEFWMQKFKQHVWSLHGGDQIESRLQVTTRYGTTGMSSDEQHMKVSA